MCGESSTLRATSSPERAIRVSPTGMRLPHLATVKEMATSPALFKAIVAVVTHQIADQQQPLHQRGDR